MFIRYLKKSWSSLITDVICKTEKNLARGGERVKYFIIYIEFCFVIYLELGFPIFAQSNIPKGLYLATRNPYYDITISHCLFLHVLTGPTVFIFSLWLVVGYLKDRVPADWWNSEVPFSLVHHKDKLIG